MRELKKIPLFLFLLAVITPENMGIDIRVDFDGGDCGREFTVSQFDIFHLKADPNPVTSGGAASCIVKFRTDSSFSVYVQHLSVQDCTARLFFYDNDNTQKYPVQTLTCLPTTPAGGTFTTRTGNLIVRLDKGSGSTKAYSFNLILTTIEGQVPNQVTDTAGGGVGTGAIIGIAVGVVAFLIIIIAVVCFFVCRQMAQQKEEKMRQLQPSVFTTAASDPSVVIEREGDRQRNRETIPNLSGSYSRRHRPYDPPENDYQQIKLPEPKTNGILKGSQRRSRRRNNKEEDSGHDNPGYSASVSSTDDSCDFDFASYQQSKGELPGAQRIKNFSMNPDPIKARQERSDRGRRNRPNSQTSDSSVEDGPGFTNKAFTDESGRSQSLGRAAGRRRFSDDDETATNYTRSTRTDRSYSPSRTENSSDTGMTYGSRFERNPNAASIRRSRSRSQSRSSTRSARKQRHHHHHDHSDQSSQGSHGHHGHHGHHGGSHRSRSREKKKSANLPIFDEVKKMQKLKK